MSKATKPKKKSKRGRTGLLVLTIICAGVLLVSAYNLLTYYAANSKAEKDFEALRPPVAAETTPVSTVDPADNPNKVDPAFLARIPYYQNLKDENPDYAAWLTAPGTNIDYPVMQTVKNQNYYIDKTFKKKYNANGSLFLSELSDVGNLSDVVTIYGHHMKTGAMFGRLEDLTKVENFAAASTVILDTLTDRYVYRVYGLFRTQVDTGLPGEFEYWNTANFADQASFDAYMSQLDPKLEIKSDAAAPAFGDKIILLSTCEYTHENGRLVLIGVLADTQHAG